FVRADELYVVGTASGARETEVTKGASPTKTHGLAEFIAEEELRRTRGFWFSPDGGSLVYEEADSSKVETLTIADPAHPEKDPEQFRYPRPGKQNAELRLGIVKTTGGATTWIDWEHAKYPYLATVNWSPRSPLTIYVLDRLQENGALLAVDETTGAT